MNRDEVIRMAKEADQGHASMECELFGGSIVSVSTLERFAQLVAAHEREECAKVCESFKQGNSATYIDDDWADMCAAAIRARSNP
ncbi:hypothetical protein [Hydrogenophaga laconesensis]|uniref:Addiction module antidote protein n=1 Tax=Hydrogenophaga laconesensis TaxID=1805971 RepID=A0ABU1V9K4_9BURK|nr:hypothetical protein [Hydrogenophaga laconesensis]MDR7094122.1 hypothetical protein [Hydrogenophaga laconesensis]